MKPSQTSSWWIGVAVLFGNFLVPAHATFTRPEEVPVERLLRSAAVIVAENPNSADAHYTLARIHYLAFSRSTRTAPAYLPSQHNPRLTIPDDYMTGSWLSRKQQEKARELMRTEPEVEVPSESAIERHLRVEKSIERRWKKLRDENWRPAKELSVAERAAHANAGLEAFQEAIRLDPGRPLQVLGLANLTEQIVDWKRADKPAGLLASLATLDYAHARARYLEAFHLAFVQDAAAKEQGLRGLSGLVSFEAGRAYLRLADRVPASAKLDSERRVIQEHLRKLERIPRGPITPIIFSLRPVGSIDQLIASAARVDFDLRGYGTTERWPWVKPETALLVWDPAAQGQIRSGRQLFGGYTFQIFRADGYAALAALDDDRDGVLHGAELQGLRAWFDRNGDARSESGEVRDLMELGIVAIAVGATGCDGIHPTNPAGLVFQDGRTLPTWDWLVAPHGN